MSKENITEHPHEERQTFFTSLVLAVFKAVDWMTSFMGTVRLKFRRFTPLDYLSLPLIIIASASFCIVLLTSIIITFDSRPLQDKPASEAAAQRLESLLSQDPSAAVALVRQALEAQPKLVADAIEAYKRQLEADLTVEIDENLWQLIAEPDESVIRLGVLDAPVIIVMFTDPNCPYCRTSLDALMPLLETRDDFELRIREFPVLGLASRNISEVAWAMHKQGLAEAFYSELSLDSRPLELKDALAIAEARGSDMARLRRDSTSNQARAALNHNLDLGGQLGIRGTPTFVINQKILRGGLNQELFKEEIETALAALGSTGKEPQN